MSSPSNTPADPEFVCVLDTCSLAEMKRLIKIDEQFVVFSMMTELLRAGRLAYPRQVATEMARVKFPDTPGAWATGYAREVKFSSPSDDCLAEAMGAAQLIDPQSENDYVDADPYVVAMALQIKEDFPWCRVVVVSDDVRDRMPRKESVRTACARLDLEHWTAEEFVACMQEHASGSGPWS